MSSLVLVKPDAIEYRLLGWCIACFEQFYINDLRLVQMDKNLCAAHYVDHLQKEFYPGLEEFMCSGKTCALSLGGGFEIVRKTAMSIRRKWPQYISGPRNLVHSSDSEEAAERELALWFQP